MKKIKTERIPNPHRRLPPVGVRLTEAEYNLIYEKAKKYADGNLSAFLRYAALKFK